MAKIDTLYFHFHSVWYIFYFPWNFLLIHRLLGSALIGSTHLETLLLAFSFQYLVWLHSGQRAHLVWFQLFNLLRFAFRCMMSSILVFVPWTLERPVCCYWWRVLWRLMRYCLINDIVEFFHILAGLTSIFYFLFYLLRAILTAYGRSQVRGQIRAAAASLHHSHSNARSEWYLWTMLQLGATLDP